MWLCHPPTKRCSLFLHPFEPGQPLCFAFPGTVLNWPGNFCFLTLGSQTPCNEHTYSETTTLRALNPVWEMLEAETPCGDKEKQRNTEASWKCILQSTLPRLSPHIAEVNCPGPDLLEFLIYEIVAQLKPLSFGSGLLYSQGWLKQIILGDSYYYITEKSTTGTALPPMYMELRLI